MDNDVVKDNYRSYSDDDVVEIAKFIAKYAKCIGVISSDADLRGHEPLYQALEAEGVEVDRTAYLKEQRYLYHDCSLLLDPDCGISFSPWQTTFVLPTLQDFAKYCNNKFPPLLVSHVNAETYWWNNRAKRFYEQYDPQSHQHATFLEPFQGDSVKLYKQCILYIHPELRDHYDRIYPVYAGAQQQLAIDKVPFRTLVDRISMAFKLGYDKIFFVNSEETLQEQSVFKCHRLIRYFSDKPADTWFHVTGCLDGHYRYQTLCEAFGVEPMMNIVSGYRFENVVLDSMPEVLEHWKLAPFVEQIEYKPEPRPKKFVCFNRVPRWHRVRLLGYMLEKNLVDKGFYSFTLSDADSGPFGDREHWVPKPIEECDENEQALHDPYVDNIYKYWDTLPLVLNRSSSRDNPVDINREDVHYHTDSYFSIVCETTFFHSMGKPGKPLTLLHTDGVFISEKMYKPLAYKHPFVTLAMPKTLEYLRKVGYKTFHPYIDETYDTIEDDELRMQAICAEVERLCNLSDNEWVELMKKLKPIVDHNQTWLGTEKPLNSTPYNILEYFKR